MIQLLESILVEDPEFPLWAVQCIPIEYLEFLSKMRNAQLDPDQVKRMVEQIAPTRQNED